MALTEVLGPVFFQIGDEMKELQEWNAKAQNMLEIWFAYQLPWVYCRCISSRGKNRFHYHLKRVNFQLKTGLAVWVHGS